MRVRTWLVQVASGPLVAALLALVLVVTVTGSTGSLARVYSQDCVDTRAKADNDNSDNDNSDNDNSDNDNDNSDNGGSSSGREFTSAVSCDAGEAVIGAQPRASDTAHEEMHAGESFLGMDGVVVVRVTAGGKLELTHDPVDPAASPGPAAPFELRQLRAANLRLLPLETPNNVDITLRYTDEDVSGSDESGIRMFYYDAGLGTWVEVPAALDTFMNTVTWTDVNVGAFVNRITRIAIFV